MDALAGLIHGVQAGGALFGRTILEPPWTIRFEDGMPLTLVVMLRGDGWIVPDDAAPVAVAAGHVALVAGREPFAIASDPRAEASPLYTVQPGGHCATPDGRDAAAELRLGVRTCGRRVEGPTAVLTGSFGVESRVSERLLNALPRVALVPQEGALCPIMDLTVAEIERDGPGQQAVLDRLLDLLLLSTLREWFERPEACPPAWYRALGDPVVGRALGLIHDEPARDWTVAALAREADVSRATLARRFTELVGSPPMTYLTEWRLSLATDLLRASDATVETVARQVGYESGFGLSVAFKRVLGTRPSAVRRLPLERARTAG